MSQKELVHIWEIMFSTKKEERGIVNCEIHLFSFSSLRDNNREAV